MTSNDLDFPHGAELTVLRSDGESWDKRGNRTVKLVSHQIGPCSIVDSHGQVDLDADGIAKWVGTVSVEAPPETDIRVTDNVQLPNGVVAMVVQPPERPVNPFTGWCPFVKFTLATPGYRPSM